MSDQNLAETSNSRRNVLKHIGVGAFGLGVRKDPSSISPITETSKRDDTVRIPTVKRGNTVLKWKEVPRVWFEHTQHSEKVASDITAEYLDKPGIQAIYSGRWENTFGGKNGLLVEAEVDPETYDGGLPDSREGIPIREVEALGYEFRDCCHHDDYDPVPGGVAAQTDAGGIGSAGFCVNNPDGNKRLLTANHLWGACEDNSAGDLNQHTDHFGDVSDLDEETDFALVKPTSFEGIDDQVFVNGIQYTVSGYKTHDGINDLISSGETCYQTGGTTCTTEGPLTGNGDVADYNCIDFENHGVKADIVTAKGDSGGPIVDLVEFSGTQYAAIIGHLSLGSGNTEVCCHWGCTDSKGSPMWGQAFHHLTDNPYNLSLC